MDNGDGSTVKATNFMPARQKTKSRGWGTKVQAAPPVEFGAQPTTTKKKQGRKPASPTDTPVYSEEKIEKIENAPNNNDSTETAKYDSIEVPCLWVNCNPHPGAIDKGQTHWTKAEIAQECQRNEENKRCLEELEAEKKMLLAKMLGAADDAKWNKKRAFVMRIQHVHSDNLNDVTDRECLEDEVGLSGSEFKADSEDEPVVKRMASDQLCVYIILMISIKLSETDFEERQATPSSWWKTATCRKWAHKGKQVVSCPLHME